MQYGTRYRIRKTDQTVVEGEYIQTKANDEDYPTFLLDDGSRLGTTRDHVLGPVDDSAPPRGIPRTFTTGVEGSLNGEGPTIDDSYLLDEDHLEQSLIDFNSRSDRDSE